MKKLFSRKSVPTAPNIPFATHEDFHQYILKHNENVIEAALEGLDITGKRVYVTAYGECEAVKADRVHLENEWKKGDKQRCARNTGTCLFDPDQLSIREMAAFFTGSRFPKMVVKVTII